MGVSWGAQNAGTQERRSARAQERKGAKAQRRKGLGLAALWAIFGSLVLGSLVSCSAVPYDGLGALWAILGSVVFPVGVYLCLPSSFLGPLILAVRQ